MENQGQDHTKESTARYRKYKSNDTRPFDSEHRMPGQHEEPGGQACHSPHQAYTHDQR